MIMDLFIGSLNFWTTRIEMNRRKTKEILKSFNIELHVRDLKKVEMLEHTRCVQNQVYPNEKN